MVASVAAKVAEDAKREAREEVIEVRKELLKEKHERLEDNTHAQGQQEKIIMVERALERTKTAEAELWDQLDRKEISAERHMEHWERADQVLSLIHI